MAPGLPDRDTVLTFALLLGGVPPMLSGLLNMVSPWTYTNFLAPGISTGTFYNSPMVWGWIETWMRLQGGDAFVAGAARVAGALSPKTTLPGQFNFRKSMAYVGIVHSLFEIWLLGTKADEWGRKHEQEANTHTLYFMVIWEFVALHIALVLMFVYALFGKQKVKSSEKKASEYKD